MTDPAAQREPVAREVTAIADAWYLTTDANIKNEVSSE